LREQLVKQVLEVLGPQLHTTAPASQGDGTDQLNRSLIAIQAASSQVDILDAMIDAASKFATRTGLFVVRGANAVGWRARGFADNEGVRSSPLELSYGMAAQAIQTRGMVSGSSSEFFEGFAEKFGAPARDGVMLPLTVRDKVVALIYADCGVAEDSCDHAALQCLVRVTGLWLEVFATRRATGVPAATSEPQAMAAAAHAPAPAPAPVAEPVPPPQPEAAAEVAPVEAAPAPVEEVHEPAPPQPAPPIPSGEDGEVHKKARRFAKLLVEEIKLYNQGKVSEGRQNRDLYDRLKDDIEKSRASYEKRYGTTVAKAGDYFNQELIRILADNDAALFGNNFRR